MRIYEKYAFNFDMINMMRIMTDFIYGNSKTFLFISKSFNYCSGHFYMIMMFSVITQYIPLLQRCKVQDILIFNITMMRKKSDN